MTDVSGLGVCGMPGVPFPMTEFVELLFAFYLDNLVDGKIDHGFTTREFFMGRPPVTDGLKLNAAALETTHELHLRRRLTRQDSEHRALSASSTGSTVSGVPITMD